MSNDGVHTSQVTQGRRSGRERRWGRKVPIIFLILSLVVAGVGALEAFFAQRSHTQTATDLLRDYGEFAAWSYERSSWNLLRSAIEGHLSIAYTNQQFAQGHATQACLQNILSPAMAQRRCDTCAPQLSGTYSFFSRIGEPVSESEWGGTLPESGVQLAVVEAAQRHARDVYAEGWSFAVLHIDDIEDAPIIAYTRIETSATFENDFEVSRDTILYGFEIDKSRLSNLYERVLRNNVLLPPTLTRDRPNSEVISVQVYGPDAGLLYASGPETGMAFAAPVERQAIFGGGQIHASVLPEVAGELIIGGLPKDRTGMLVLIFSMAGALAALAIVQLRREDQLSVLRQDFVASVSHELRTPLAQVRLFTETLRLGRTKTEDQREWALENIDRETLRLSNLVENILHFSRTERGVGPLGRDSEDLSAAIHSAVGSFRPLVPKRKATIVEDLPDALIAEIHRDSIRQVVLNLLDNAVRYGPAGQTIRVTGAKADGFARISVDDEGPGVPLEERDRVFEPFQRGGGAIGSVVVGSGIGLAVVNEIISAHEGHVWVEDAPGGGARFTFELPLDHTAHADDFSPGRDRAGDRESAGSEVA